MGTLRDQFYLRYLTPTMSRVLLSARSVLRVPSRGKALENWARPSIDELGVPTESWSAVHARNNKRYTAQLVAGVSFFAFTLYVLAGRVNLNPTPKHLLK